MIFRHPYLLLGLLAIAVPIAIHLLNRRSAKVVHWGAMHFLLGSLVSRKRHVLLEEVLLLSLRCLLAALVVLTVARPVITAGSSAAWALVLPLVLGGAVALAVGVGLWQQAVWRWRMLALSAAMFFLAAVTAFVGERIFKSSNLGGVRDVALVIDGSNSMTLQVGGRSNFARAVEEAQRLVKTLHRSSTVSIILAGPLPEMRTPHPLTDGDRVQALLAELQPTGGAADMHEALEAAAAALAAGSHATRTMAVFSDGQSAGWNMDDATRWRTAAATLRTVAGAEPEVVCRTFDIPREFRNLAVTELAAARNVVGVDRPLPILRHDPQHRPRPGERVFRIPLHRRPTGRPPPGHAARSERHADGRTSPTASRRRAFTPSPFGPTPKTTCPPTTSGSTPPTCSRSSRC